MVAKQQITMAVEVVEANLGAMQDVGYQSWTVSKAAEQLVSSLNSANVRLPDEPKLPGIAGKIKYVQDEVTGPWQIVLIPDDDTSTILIEGYGRDTSKPIHTKEIEVMPF